MTLRAHSVCGPFSVSCGSEVEEEGEIVDGHVSVAGVLAHEVGVTVLKTEVVQGSDGVTSPGAGSYESIPSVLDGFTKLSWEDGGIGLLEESEGEEGEFDDLVGHANITIHGAGEVGHYSFVIINNYKIDKCQKLINKYIWTESDIFLI